MLEREPNIVKPANFPDEAVGRSWATVTARDGTQVAVFSLLGRSSCGRSTAPSTAADRVLAAMPADVKVRLRRLPRRGHQRQAADGPLPRRPRHRRAGHAHPRADGRRMHPARRHGLSVRRRHDRAVRQHPRPPDRPRAGNALTFNPTQFDVATGDVRLCGSIVDIDAETGRATAIERICVRESDLK